MSVNPTTEAVVTRPDAVASVRHISSAPSFDGTLHEPDWFYFAIECNDSEDAALFAAYLRERSMFPVRTDATVTLRLDRAQPETDRIPREAGFIAISHAWADPDQVLEAVLLSGV